MKVAIIGAGPHGLAAAWAAVNAGSSVDIFDKDPGAENHGVFYLTNPMKLSIPSQIISTGWCPSSWTYEFASRAYAKKVYGTENQTVPLKRDHGATVYDGQAALEQLNFMFRGQIIQREFTGREELLSLLEKYSRVIVTIPAPVFIKDKEKGWPSRVAWVRSETIHDAPERGRVVYFPNPDVPWTRVSLVFGRLVVEQIDIEGEGVEGLRKVKKVVTVPRSHFEDWPSGIIWCGRYGAWDKDVLVLDTYTRVYDEISA